MRLGYNTNGLAHHEPLQAFEVLAQVGYLAVGVTLDHGLLNPFSPSWPDALLEVRKSLQRCGLSSVIETGARFLLDPRSKHEPTLVAVDPQRAALRIEFLKRAIDAAKFLESDCVSLWSGVVRDQAPEDEVWRRLVRGLSEVLEYAERCGVVIGFEPEPGMFVDTMSRFAELRQRLTSPKLQLTLDVGHLHCLGEVPIVDQIAMWGSSIVNIHIEDMRRGIHEHLMFGEGEMEFPPIIAALAGAGYRGGVHVELSRHSHDAPRAVQQAFEFLHPLVKRYASG